MSLNKDFVVWWAVVCHNQFGCWFSESGTLTRVFLVISPSKRTSHQLHEPCPVPVPTARRAHRFRLRRRSDARPYAKHRFKENNAGKPVTRRSRAGQANRAPENTASKEPKSRGAGACLRRGLASLVCVFLLVFNVVGSGNFNNCRCGLVNFFCGGDPRKDQMFWLG